MADKPAKVDKKVKDLQGQNATLLSKLLKKLDKNASSDRGSAGKKDDKAGRSIFQEIGRSVITGYSKPGSQQVTGPNKFFGPLFDKLGGEDTGDKDIAPKSQPAWWKKLIGPALMILGGLAALVMGLMTDGPLKGFLKLLAQGGIMGGMKWLGNVLSRFVGTAVKSLKFIFGSGAVDEVMKAGKGLITRIVLPFKRFFISTIPKFIGRLVAPIAKLVGSSGGTVTKMLAKVGVFVAKNLKFIPLLGGLISFGFAISRFRKGDIIGGSIDLVSGVLGMVPPGPWSAVTIPLSIGLSVLNAVLDAKSGGATGKQQSAKGDMLKRWAGKLFGMIAEIPPISNVYHLAQGFIQGVKGNWKAAANHFMYSIPVVGTLLDWFGVGFKNPEGKPIEGNKSSFFSKLIGFITKLPPISNIIDLGKGIAAIFQGNWGDAALYFAYSIPVVGNLLSWFNVGSPGEPKGEKIKGSKKGFFSKIGNWLMDSFPLKNIRNFVGGIGDVFSGDFSKGLTKMAFAIPFMTTLHDFIYGEGSSEQRMEAAGTPGAGDLNKEFKLNALKRILKWVPKTIMGINIRSRVAKFLSKTSGYSTDVLMGIAPEPERDIAGDMAEGTDNMAASVDQGTGTLDKATEHLSSATKNIEAASSGFGKSSPGVWIYLKQASSVLTANIKKIASGVFAFAMGLSGLARVVPLVSYYLQQITSKISSRMRGVLNAATGVTSSLLLLFSKTSGIIMKGIGAATGRGRDRESDHQYQLLKYTKWTYSRLVRIDENIQGNGIVSGSIAQYTKNGWLRLKKIHTTIEDIQRLLKGTPKEALSNITKAQKAQKASKEMVAEQDTKRLTDSIKLQQDFLTELREGSLVQILSQHAQSVQDQLTQVIENTGNVGMPLVVAGSTKPGNTQGGPSAIAAQRMGNRDF